MKVFNRSDVSETVGEGTYMSKAAVALGKASGVVLERITIERAKVIFENRARNRSVSDAVVDRLASDMSAGRWQVNGETVKFNSDGVLVDGQHRIAASIKSGVDLLTYAAYGIDDYAEVDTGRRKTISDSLIMFDGRVPGPRTALSIDGALGHLVSYGLQTPSSGRSGLSHSAKLNIIRHSPDLGRCLPRLIAEFVTEGGAAGKATPLRPSIALALLWLCEIGDQDRDLITKFLRAVKDGIGLSDGEPALAYRNMIIAAGLRKRFISTREAFRLGLNAAIAHLVGRKIQLIRPSSATFPGATPKRVLAILGLAQKEED